jgi:hypothetical protein
MDVHSERSQPDVCTTNSSGGLVLKQLRNEQAHPV